MSDSNITLYNKNIMTNYLRKCSAKKNELNSKNSINDLKNCLQNENNRNFGTYLYECICFKKGKKNENNKYFFELYNKETGKDILIDALTKEDFTLFDKSTSDISLNEDEKKSIKKLNANKRRLTDIFFFYAHKNNVYNIEDEKKIKRNFSDYINNKKIPSRETFFEIAFALNLSSKEVIKCLCDCLNEPAYIIRNPEEFLIFSCHTIKELGSIETKNRLLENFHKKIKTVYLDNYTKDDADNFYNSFFKNVDDYCDKILKFTNIIIQNMDFAKDSHIEFLSKLLCINIKKSIFNRSKYIKDLKSTALENTDYKKIMLLNFARIELFQIYYKNIILFDNNINVLNDIFKNDELNEKIKSFKNDELFTIAKKFNEKNSDLDLENLHLDNINLYFENCLSEILQILESNYNEADFKITLDRTKAENTKKSDLNLFFTELKEYLITKNISSSFINDIKNKFKNINLNSETDEENNYNFTRLGKEEINKLNMQFKNKATSQEDIENRIINYMIYNFKDFDDKQKTIYFLYINLYKKLFKEANKDFNSLDFLKIYHNEIDDDDFDFLNSEDYDEYLDNETYINSYVDYEKLEYFYNQEENIDSDSYADYSDIRLNAYIPKIEITYEKNNANKTNMHFRLMLKKDIEKSSTIKNMTPYITSRGDLYHLINENKKIKKQHLLLLLLYEYVLHQDFDYYRDKYRTRDKIIVEYFNSFIGYADEIFRRLGLPGIYYANPFEKYILMSLLNPMNFEYIQKLFYSKKLNFIKVDSDNSIIFVTDTVYKYYYQPSEIKQEIYSVYEDVDAKSCLKNYLPLKKLNSDKYYKNNDHQVFIKAIKCSLADDYIEENDAVYIKDRIITPSSKAKKYFELDYVIINNDLYIKSATDRYVNEIVRKNVVYVKCNKVNKANKNIYIKDDIVYILAEKVFYTDIKEKDNIYYMDNRKSKSIINAFYTLD